jgi:ATP-dependent DNA ligase
MGFLIEPPVLPMLAKRVDAIPAGDTWSFEPKWDGFRAVIFRDGEELLIQSRDGKPLDRYFPELRAPLLEGLPERCVVDGEIVIAGAGGLDFDALSLRIHPAASRVKTLSEEIPAEVVLFDLLAVGEEVLVGAPFEERRRRLEAMFAGVGESFDAKGAKEGPKGREGRAVLHLTPATRDRAVAEDWFSRFEGAGLDGVMAKALAGAYTPDKRTMLKIKHERDCDCVVAGFRWHKNGGETMVGSLLLGLYDEAGRLQHVGTCSSFTEAKRKELVEFLAAYRVGAEKEHPWAEWGGANAEGSRMPGAKSRWTGGKDLSWVLLRPELVAEVAYEHMQGDRFRHLAHFRRWRVDKAPRDCTYAQLEVVAAVELKEIFGG